MKQTTQPEVIIKEHRRWTRWVAGRRALGIGNLVLTNRRLIFLHMIQSSPEVSEKIKRLADAPIEKVLDYAFTLNRSNFQVPLTSIMRVQLGTRGFFPLPHFSLLVTFVRSKRQPPETVAFQFIRPILQVFLRPHIIVCLGWVKAIKQAMKEVAEKDTK